MGWGLGGRKKRRSRPGEQRLTSELVIALAVALAAGIYSLRTALPDTNEGLTTLYALPVALLASRFGAAAGALAAAVSLALFWIWDQTSAHVSITTLGYATRAIGFFLLGVLLGYYATQRRALVEELRSLAETDSLTGLANRKRFEDDLEAELSLARRHDRRGALLLADLDGFKAVNDSLGHRAGDEVLKRTAHRLQDATRDSDLVARLGGDEFVVLLREVSEEGAELAARRLVDAVTSGNGPEGNVGLTVGVAPFDHNTPLGATALVDEADRAMYRAKKATRIAFDGDGAKPVAG